MTTEKFIKKAVIKLIILIIVCVGISTFLSAGSAILGNYVALGQMENNDALFILMEMYMNFFKPTLSVVLIMVSVYLVVGINIDIYKFIKIKKENISNEKN